MSFQRRRLCLGSVSSLSFEEEENQDTFGLDSYSEERAIDPGNNNNNNHHSHELLDLLTTCLEEQVEILIRRATDTCWSFGLHQTLHKAVHDILRLSESEPYGVRGATIIVKMRSFKGDCESYLGSIAVDVSTVSTFNLILVLNEGRRLGVTLKNWLGQLTGAKQACVIDQAYTLKKEKLYRSDSGATLDHYQM